MIPQFSILMANYNNGRYIDDAIRSVLAQTFTDWEMIIVDDASKDDSLERIERYLGDPRIRPYAREKNEGYIKALIYGLTKVSSEIVGILDSDDALMPEAIEKAHRVHTERPELGVVLSQTIRTDPNLKPLYVFATNRTEPLLWLRGGTHFRTFKLASYNKTTGLDPHVPYAEDWDLVIKLEEVAPAYRIPEPLYMYRYLSSSLSQAPESHHKGLRSLAVVLYKAYLRRRRTSLPNIPRAALLAWIVAAVEYSLDLREPWRAMSCALRGLRISSLDGAAWRALIRSMRACVSLASPTAWGVDGGKGFVTLRSYPVRVLRNNTGNIEPDRVVCVPLIHKEGYCLLGGETWVPESGQYNVTFKIAIDAYSFAEDPLAVLDVYENLQTKTVLAERQIRLVDLAGGPRSFSVEFHAKEGQRVEFRVYWREQCFLTVSKVILQKAQ
jgi:glycosyltransferase involved in cell wall biosynthesis